jgi:hypothetical protein
MLYAQIGPEFLNNIADSIERQERQIERLKRLLLDAEEFVSGDLRREIHQELRS